MVFGVSIFAELNGVVWHSMDYAAGFDLLYV